MHKSRKIDRNKIIRIVKPLVIILGIIFVLYGIARAWKAYADYRVIDRNRGKTIVCFGDSIWDLDRDETGIAYLLSEKLDANVVNMCIGGTGAAKRGVEEPLDQLSFVDVIDGITGGERSDSLEKQNERIGICDYDYSQADYFLIAYGLNDYFCGVERENQDPYDVHTYAGALRTGIEKLQAAYPDAEIMILSSTYHQLYSYGKVKAESHELDYGGGNGREYVATAKKVAEEYGLGFSNNYDTIHINVYNGTKYLRDATHFTEKGRKAYAKVVADAIIEDYKRREKEE